MPFGTLSFAALGLFRLLGWLARFVGGPALTRY